MIRKNIRLGDLLLQIGKISEEQLEEAIKAQKTSHKRLGEILIDLEYIKGKEMNEVLEYQLGIPHIDLERHYIEPEIPHMIDEAFARENVLIPIGIEEEEMTVAMNDPFNIIAINDMQKMTSLKVKP